MTATPMKGHLRNVPSSPHLLKFGLMSLPGVQAQWTAARHLTDGLSAPELWMAVWVLALAIVCVATTLWWRRVPTNPKPKEAALNAAPRPPALEHVQNGTDFMGVGPSLTESHIGESTEAVEVDPGLANGAQGYESRRSELPVATPVQATGHVVAALFAPRVASRVITEYQYVEGPASAEKQLRSATSKTSPRAARQSR